MGNGGKFRGRVEAKRRQLDFKEKQEIEQRTTQHGGSPPRRGAVRRRGNCRKHLRTCTVGERTYMQRETGSFTYFVAVRAASLRDASSNFLMKVSIIISVFFSIGCGV